MPMSNELYDFQTCRRGGAPSSQPAAAGHPSAAANTASNAGKATTKSKADSPKKKTASRRMSTDLAANFGTISDTWRDAASWQSFTAHLAQTAGEGLDSENRQMSFLRYAIFLELYVELDQAERVRKLPEPELKALVIGIRYG